MCSPRHEFWVSFCWCCCRQGLELFANECIGALASLQPRRIFGLLIGCEHRSVEVVDISLEAQDQTRAKLRGNIAGAGAVGVGAGGMVAGATARADPLVLDLPAGCVPL